MYSGTRINIRGFKRNEFIVIKGIYKGGNDMKPNITDDWWGTFNNDFTKWYQFYGTKLMWTIG